MLTEHAQNVKMDFTKSQPDLSVRHVQKDSLPETKKGPRKKRTVKVRAT